MNCSHPTEKPYNSIEILAWISLLEECVRSIETDRSELSAKLKAEAQVAIWALRNSSDKT